MLKKLLNAIREALTVYRRRRVIKANIRRMSARLPF
jgi:hypothetical protein